MSRLERYLRVETIRALDSFGKFCLWENFFAAEAGSGDFMQAQNLARVELPAAEFLELREQMSSVAREVWVRSHISGIFAIIQKPERFRDASDTRPPRTHSV
jgi:hypothetical protein